MSKNSTGKNGSKTFKEVCEIFQKVEMTASRNEMTALVVDFIKSSQIEDVQIFSYLIKGRVAPLFLPAEFNFSEKSVLKVLVKLCESHGVSNFDPVADRKATGDVGLASFNLFQILQRQDKINPVEVSIADVYSQLWQIINTKGTGSAAQKSEIFVRMANSMSPIEVKFTTRIISGKMRLGLSEKTFLDALSFVKAGDKSFRAKLDRLYGVKSDLGEVAKTVLEKSELEESDFEATPGIPLFSRLVERVKDFNEVFDRLGERFYLQPKFDGLRCQVHKGVDYEKLGSARPLWSNYMHSESAELAMFADIKEERGIKLFSRNLEDMTEMFPDVVEAVAELNVESCILDCEVIGWNYELEKFFPFQETMTRKRKYEIDSAKSSVPVRLFMFDVVYLNGKSLVHEPTSARYEKFDQVVKGYKGRLITIAETRIATEISAVEDFFEESVAKGLEGIIAKHVDVEYEPGVRNFEWIKLKKSMDKKLVDTVDLVIMGYYYGSGKKVGFGMGALLGGVYNKESGMIESVTKIGTGITDEQWGTIAKRLKKIEIADIPKQYVVGKLLTPDVWVMPDVVCSVEADEITKSKAHKAGESELGYGLALRFPRLIEFDRDKSVEDATSVGEFVRLWKLSKEK